ncbi:MAG: NAD(P)-binding domain-containing protein [Phycisphaerales bacterium]|nr:NAD(P)-binding domain-containing protein [Phycisphaerales bacterium]
MKIGILGTGMVGATIATKLVALGHEVMMGSRNSGSEKAVAWAQANGANASQGSFAQAARFGEILFNCTQGTASIEALQSAGADNLKGKILIDVANPLDFSRGMPPLLSICNTDSLGEQIPQDVSRDEGRQDAQHGELRSDGQSRARAGRSRHLCLRQ